MGQYRLGRERTLEVSGGVQLGYERTKGNGLRNPRGGKERKKRKERKGSVGLTALILRAASIGSEDGLASRFVRTCNKSTSEAWGTAEAFLALTRSWYLFSVPILHSRDHAHCRLMGSSEVKHHLVHQIKRHPF